jgi:hypothetical protein
MPGPLRPWNNVPNDSALGSETQRFLSWVMTTLYQLQAPLTPLAAPIVTTVSQPNSVQVVWNEVPGAVSYAVFETNTKTPPAGVPFQTVPANIGGLSNSILRPNITDTITRFYWVQAIASSPSARGPVSLPAPGKAAATTTTNPISQVPVNQSGVGGGAGIGGGVPGILNPRVFR